MCARPSHVPSSPSTDSGCAYTVIVPFCKRCQPPNTPGPGVSPVCRPGVRVCMRAWVGARASAKTQTGLTASAHPAPNLPPSCVLTQHAFCTAHLLPLTTLKHVCLPSTPPSPSLHTREHPSNTTQTPSLAPLFTTLEHVCLPSTPPSSPHASASLEHHPNSLPPPLFTTLKHV